jgi:hypothetical protein
MVAGANTCLAVSIMHCRSKAASCTEYPILESAVRLSSTTIHLSEEQESEGHTFGRLRCIQLRLVHQLSHSSNIQYDSTMGRYFHQSHWVCLLAEHFQQRKESKG